MVKGELGYPAITRLEVDLTLFQPLRVPKERKVTETNYKCHTQFISGIVHLVKKPLIRGKAMKMKTTTKQV